MNKLSGRKKDSQTELPPLRGSSYVLKIVAELEEKLEKRVLDGVYWETPHIVASKETKADGEETHSRS